MWGMAMFALPGRWEDAMLEIDAVIKTLRLPECKMFQTIFVTNN